MRLVNKALFYAWDYNTSYSRACKLPTCKKNCTLYTCCKITVIKIALDKNLMVASLSRKSNIKSNLIKPPHRKGTHYNFTI
jgi:hypothetical protein